MSTVRTSTKSNNFRTEFQNYCLLENVIDITERRLLILLKNSLSSKRRQQLIIFLESYKEGKSKIAWSNGEPICLKLDL